MYIWHWSSLDFLPLGILYYKEILNIKLSSLHIHL